MPLTGLMNVYKDSLSGNKNILPNIDDVDILNNNQKKRHPEDTALAKNPNTNLLLFRNRLLSHMSIASFFRCSGFHRQLIQKLSILIKNKSF